MLSHVRHEGTPNIWARGHEGSPTSMARGHAENLGTRARGHANIEGTRARRARRARHLTDSNRTDRSSKAVAYFPFSDESGIGRYVCKIQFFFCVSAIVVSRRGDRESRIIPFAFVDWYRPASNSAVAGLKKTKKTFYKNNNIVGVQRLCQRVVTLEMENDQLVMPLPN